MNLTELSAVSPIDGRYRSKTKSLAAYFSEFGLIRYRVLVEIEYFIALCESGVPQLSAFPKDKYAALREVYDHFTEAEAQRIKDIEKVTNHDVKAVEYFLREEFEKLGLGNFVEFIHFGLTSQDINNTSIPVSLKEGMHDVIIPEIQKILDKLTGYSQEWKNISLLARTHGQPASPTRLGKEFGVFTERISKQLQSLQLKQYFGKFGGATGNFNAHHVAFPEINWTGFGNDFLQNRLGLQRNQLTTQIDHYDDLAEIFDNLRRLNVILLDLCKDVWLYIMEDYFKQKVEKNEVGSSAMPHKVNPIDFENAEGNLGIANAILDHLSNKLPVSRLQRDLTDSTVLRNIGVPLGHSLIAYQSILKGLGKLVVNEAKIKQALEDNWAVVAEAIQTILRREGYPHPYEKLKQFTRGKSNLDKKVFEDFIDHLDISDELKKQLREITPFNYTGL
jgi:adenylosuccinate lyase